MISRQVAAALLTLVTLEIFRLSVVVGNHVANTELTYGVLRGSQYYSSHVPTEPSCQDDSQRIVPASLTFHMIQRMKSSCVLEEPSRRHICVANFNASDTGSGNHKGEMNDPLPSLLQLEESCQSGENGKRFFTTISYSLECEHSFQDSGGRTYLIQVLHDPMCATTACDMEELAHKHAERIFFVNPDEKHDNNEWDCHLVEYEPRTNTLHASAD